MYIKMLFGYILFGICAIVILCTFTQHTVTSYLERREAQHLYRESNLIASGYASNFMNSSLSLEDFQSQMEMLSTYLSAEIWVVDNQGNILFNSSDAEIGQKAVQSEYTVLPDFDSTDFGNRFYTIGRFYGMFEEDTLSVFSPITSNYRVRNYVLIHKPVSSTIGIANEFMNIAFYTVGILALCALLILLVFSYTNYRSLRRITKVAQSYAKGNFEPRIDIHTNDMDRDFWMYISMEYFKQKIKAGEVGSSAMPHKVNPIDFENSEGNLGISNAFLQFLAAKLPVSRLQRDLTDSTVLRNIGVPLGHTLIAIQSTLKGLRKLILNEDKIDADLDNTWAVVAEAIQTILRREGYPHPYEALKALTRTNKKMTEETIHEFIQGLDVSDKVKKELMSITPHNYYGI